MQISSTNNINKIIDNKQIHKSKQSQAETVNDRVTSGSEKISGSLWRAMTQKIDPYGARSYLVKEGLVLGLSPSDISNLVKVMEKGSVETSNIEMLFGLVKEGDLSKRTIRYVCAEGMMSESMEKDIDLIYEAKADGADVNERYVPHRANREEALSKAEVGDVFAIDGEKNIFIKNKDGEAEQLKMDRDMYLSLFPVAERFASAQNRAGDCYYLTAINAMMDNPNSRSKVLQCFEQDGDNIKIKFPDSDYEYISENAKLPKTAEKKMLLTGATGLQLLEHAFGYKEEADAVRQYREFQNGQIESLKKEIETCNDEYYKRELTGRLANFERNNQIFEEDRASKNPRLVLLRDSSLNILTDDYSGGIFRNVDQLGKVSGRFYDAAADFYRAEGGFSENVFNSFGYEAEYQNVGSIEADKILRHFDDTDSYIIAGGTRGGRHSFEKKLDRSMSMYTRHAYRIIPFKDSEGNEKYRVSNPWNSSHDAVMTLEDINKYFDEVCIAKVK